MRIAILSAREFAGKMREDLRLQEGLEALDIKADIIPWEQEGTNWAAYDGAVMRSVWGYHQHMAAFRAWLEEIKEADLPLINPYDTLMRNIYKHRQMAQLIDQGLPVLPTAFLSRAPGREPLLRPPETTLAASLQAHFPGERGPFVMKPIVSASGRDTVLIEKAPSAEAEALYTALLDQRENVGVMLQPYLPQVAEGEYALVYIGGEYSHCVLRFTGVLTGENTARAVDTPPPEFRLLADDVMAGQYEAMPVYARVDLVPTDQGPVIMELELAEPYLYLDDIPQPELRDAATRRFCEEILAEMEKQRNGYQ